jgi:hypothetical protein
MYTRTTARFSIATRALLIGVVIFVSYAYFYQGGGWNQNSRFDLVRAVIERRTLRIDAYCNNTGDRALVSGHYYSDKAPGLASIALPVAATTRALLHAVKIDPNSARGLIAESYFATVLGVGLPATLASICFFSIGLRLGGSVAAAAFACLVMALGTPLWAYGTLFWGHALASACLLFAFAAALLPRRNQSRRSTLFWGLIVGLTAGWATVTEYPAAPASAILAIFALRQVWSDGWLRRLWTAAGIAIGALGCIGVLAIYQHEAFGSVLHPGYTYYPNGAFPWMKTGFMGLTYPKVEVMWKLLFGCRRGLLLLSPVLAAAPFGFPLLWKQSPTRPAAIAAASVAAYYFLLNASFYIWAGGWSYGPRYMAAGVPFLCIGLAPLWRHARVRSRRLYMLTAIFGGVSSLIAVSVTAQPPDVIPCPLPPVLWSEFWTGQLSINRVSMLTLAEDVPAGTHGSFNLGQIAGLHGLASLLPLVLLWAAAAYLWYRLDRRSLRDPGGESTSTASAAI